MLQNKSCKKCTLTHDASSHRLQQLLLLAAREGCAQSCAKRAAGQHWLPTSCADDLDRRATPAVAAGRIAEPHRACMHTPDTCMCAESQTSTAATSAS